MTPPRDPLTGQAVSFVKKMAEIRSGVEAAAMVLFADAELDQATVDDALDQFAASVVELRRLVPDPLFHQYAVAPARPASLTLVHHTRQPDPPESTPAA